MIRILAAGLLAVSIAAVSACGGSGSRSSTGTLHPAVDSARATGIARTALEGLNRGDYAAWSAAWSDTMRSAIGPDAFEQFRDGILARSGTFVSIDGVELSAARTAGFVKYTFAATFTKARLVYSLVLRENGELVEGCRLDPAA